MRPHDSRALRAELTEAAYSTREVLFGLLFGPGGAFHSTRVMAWGGPTSILFDPRDIALRAAEPFTTSVLLVHNHPNGVPQPSEADRATTNELAALFSQRRISLLDHLVITPSTV